MKPITRRAALRGFGGILVSLPVLEGCTSFDGLWSGPARQVEARRESLVEDPAKRFIALMCPDGMEPDFWFPTGSGRDFTLNVQNAPLEPIKQHLILTKGIANQVAIDQNAAGFGNGHTEGVQSLLTGFQNRERVAMSNDWYSLGGPSIDRMISAMHERDGYVGRVRGIHLGEEGVGGYSSISIGEDSTRADYTWDMSVLFDSPGSATAIALENARLRRRSILDGTIADYTRLQARVSGEDRLRIDAHLESLRSIERRMETVVTCVHDTFPMPADGDERRDLIYDIITAAMSCDAARVATVVFHHSGGGGPQLPFVGVFEDIHELSHQVVGEPAEHGSHGLFTAYHQWWSRKTLRFVENLKSIRMPDGTTLFDETVIFQGSEISWNHGTVDMPFLILAGERTPFDTGRFVDLPTGQLHTHLLVTLLQAFGHDATHVGDPVYPAGDLNAAFFKA